MPLPKSLTQPLRQGQLTVGSGWRAYFAPFNQQLAVSQSSTAIGPSIYDLQVFNRMVDGALPAGWRDLGYIDNVKFTPGSKVGNVITGYRGAIRAKYRAEVGEKLQFDFQEVSRMSMSIGSGMQVFNYLATTSPASTAGPLSASGTPAIAMGASGYSATGFAGATSGLPTLCVPAGSGALFTAGGMLVCDQDYTPGNFGFTGDAGANVFPGAVTNPDFIRMTSDYVNGVVQVIPGAVGSQDAIILTGPFVGGGNSLTGVPNTGPTTGAKVQVITGYGPREGGTSLKEWSAVFVLGTVDGSQILKYYPRVAPDVSGGMTGKNLTGATSLQMYGSSSTFDAMAYDDPLDGETVVSYMGYFPHPGTAPAI